MGQQWVRPLLFDVLLPLLLYSYLMFRITLLLVVALLAACRNDIYVRDGVTGGNRYHISPQSLLDDDPVLQSWVAYSLSKSICQLEIGGDNPARANSYGCELSSRLRLLDEWAQQRAVNPQLQHAYLDTLAKVQEAAYLDEYVVHYFGKKGWMVPAEVDSLSFQHWRRKNLRGHKSYTRVVGSWSYAKTDSD